MQIPVVIEAPVVVVTATEAKAAKVFSADDGDGYIDMLLAVAQSQIDGSEGVLGRAIGLQTLEMTVWANSCVDTTRLPLPNYIDTVSDTLSADGRTRAFRWRAGYLTPSDVPPAIKHAIIMMAGVLRDAVPSDEGSLKSKTIDGVGRWDYSLPDGAAATMRSAADALLSQFRVPRV